MRWSAKKPFNEGSERRRSGFLSLPMRLTNQDCLGFLYQEWRWLEFAKWTEVWEISHGGYWRRTHWED